MLPTLPNGRHDIERASASVTFLEAAAELHVVGGRRRHSRSHHAELLCCNVSDGLPRRPFLHVLSNTYFAPLLLANRHHGAALRASLGSHPFRALSRWLLRPAAHIEDEVCRDGVSSWAPSMVHGSKRQFSRTWLARRGERLPGRTQRQPAPSWMC